MTHKWTPAQRKRFSTTMAARKRNREVFKEAPGLLSEWGKQLQRDEITKAMMKPTLLETVHDELKKAQEENPLQPNTIFVLINGTLKPFVLRTMPVYIPEEDLR